MRIEFFKKKSGITLIALVITIVILIILAGVSVFSLVKSDGIFGKAQKAVSQTKKAQVEEEVDLAYREIQAEAIFQSWDIQKKAEELEKKLKKRDKDTKVEVDNTNLIVTYKGYVVTIENNGNIRVENSGNEEKPNQIKPVGNVSVVFIEGGAEITITATTAEGEIAQIRAITPGAIEKARNGNVAEKTFIVHQNGKYSFEITGTNGATETLDVEITDVLESSSLLEGISKIQYSGVQKVKVKGETEEQHSLNVIMHKGDLTLDGQTQIRGATLTDKIYEFGSQEDVATNGNQAKNTVVLKVDGNLTINKDVMLTAVKSGVGYGGPKGMIVYCTGTLSNQGTISMTARGAYADGQNVYLWKNKDGSYETVPAVGASGGEGYVNNQVNVGMNGKRGQDGSNRKTGGGASGGSTFGDEGGSLNVLRGGNGTSYSGGVGSGAINANGKGVTSGNLVSDNGGTGGAGRVHRDFASWAARTAAGGTGNPGGMGITHVGNSSLDGIENATYKGNDGTGGLLVIYADEYQNNGKVEANGVGSTDSVAVANGVAGGASGGGSINIFYNKCICNVSYHADGGKAYDVDGGKGGDGGNGSIVNGKIENGTFVDETVNLEMEEQTIALLKIDNNEEIIGNSGQTLDSKEEHQMVFKVVPQSVQVQWSSSDENVATVDANGNVKAAGKGEATITCKVVGKYGEEKTRSCKVQVEERLYLYYRGNQFKTITGGYETSARTGRRFVPTLDTNHIYIDCNASYGGGGVYTSNKIDLTNYRYLCSEGEVNGNATSDSSGRMLNTTSTKTWGSAAWPANYSTANCTGSSKGIITMRNDISKLTGEHYVCNGFNQSHGHIYAFWLEK